MDKGERGPHPDIKSLPHFAVIIRAETMGGEAQKQAKNEALDRGLWITPWPKERS